MEREGRVDFGRRGLFWSNRRDRESTDESIADLEAELRRAYWKKSLKVQIASKEAKKSLDMAKGRLETEANRLRASIELEEEARSRLRRIAEARESASRELAEREASKREERERRREEGLREREVLEEVERRLEEREKSRTLERKLELRAERAEERRIVAELREIRRANEREEEERIKKDGERYSREIERRANDARSRANEHEERRERVLTSLLSTILEEDMRKREREVLLEELVLVEIELDRTIKDWKEKKLRTTRTLELLDSLNEQISLTELCKIKFLLRDKEFAEESMRRLAEDERTLRLTAEAKRRAILRYREDLERMIAERRRIRDEEIHRIEREFEKERRMEELRAETVKIERRYLLLEHASNVGEFLSERHLTERERDVLERRMSSTISCDRVSL
ncbi:trichohyalin-like [Vespa crabro]|uniref:trichohyalin-like n=1 Tax=Vespa crabro TaxID=7445 RepID=UPI001F0065BF|nr:trichohyalin-like [Vespa crabro]